MNITILSTLYPAAGKITETLELNDQLLALEQVEETIEADKIRVIIAALSRTHEEVALQLQPSQTLAELVATLRHHFETTIVPAVYEQYWESAQQELSKVIERLTTKMNSIDVGQGGVEGLHSSREKGLKQREISKYEVMLRQLRKRNPNTQ